MERKEPKARPVLEFIARAFVWYFMAVLLIVMAPFYIVARWRER